MAKLMGGHQIIKQPDGRLAVWSNRTCDFVLWDAAEKDVADFLVMDEEQRIRENVKKVVKQLEEGGKPYFEFTMSFEKACAYAQDYHGPKWRFGVRAAR